MRLTISKDEIKITNGEKREPHPLTEEVYEKNYQIKNASATATAIYC